MKDQEKPQDIDLTELEKLFVSTSELLVPLYQGNQDNFNTGLYLKNIRQIKRALHEKLKELGISTNISNAKLIITPAMAGLCMQLAEGMTQAGIQGLYVSEFKVAQELYDILCSLEG